MTILWHKPKAGLTASQAAKTAAYARARARGAGVIDAIMNARWLNASQAQRLEQIKARAKRSKAAKLGHKRRKEESR